MSDSLARLRGYFDDPLLVSAGRKFVLSDLATQIEPVIDQMLSRVEVLLGLQPFDPQAFLGRVKVSAPGKRSAHAAP
ncbi:hypothetical protein CAF53_26355 [Sphingobium sp. LB126]|uniref:hypothetical protein n=1 Tax=Sphingobium sp. LB126 TaxID=1983755 RepID=UPI000CA8F7ED|nr:hypothetical protein [Sphingobium sp. LB126]PJG44997.1 hypothetical protein CAF53_26355 [Sphingobium sp. LB126]